MSATKNFASVITGVLVLSLLSGCSSRAEGNLPGQVTEGIDVSITDCVNPDSGETVVQVVNSTDSLIDGSVWLAFYDSSGKQIKGNIASISAPAGSTTLTPVLTSSYPENLTCEIMKTQFFNQ